MIALRKSDSDLVTNLYLNVQPCSVFTYPSFGVLHPERAVEEVGDRVPEPARGHEPARLRERGLGGGGGPAYKRIHPCIISRTPHVLAHDQ
eukprot:351535-Chlamydomonas_euryale.AAC.1